jgi:carnitine 3-dehydrogenase
VNRQVRTVAVVGTGVIGTSWAVHFLAHGLSVVASDPAPEAEDRLRSAVERLWPVATRLAGAPDASPDRLRFEADARSAAAVADFVQENTTEDLDAKQTLLADLDEATGADVVLASSSSALVPSALQEKCTRAPERVLVAHPFDPPHLVPLVEVVGGACTSAQALTRAVDFYRSVGKRPVVLRKEVPGHIANRLQAALWREAYSLVDAGIATVADVDAAVSNGPGLRWAQYGPFVNLHLSGGAGGMARMHEHLGPAMESLWADFSTPSLTAELVGEVNRQTAGLVEELGGERLAHDRERLLVTLLEAQRKQWGTEPNDMKGREDA